MSTVMGKRLSRLEASSAWGGKTELASASLVFMRVPEGGESDSRVIASRMDYERRGQGFCVTSSPAASGLPMWTPVPIDRVAIELIDAAIEALQDAVAHLLDGGRVFLGRCVQDAAPD